MLLIFGQPLTRAICSHHILNLAAILPQPLANGPRDEVGFIPSHFDFFLLPLLSNLARMGGRGEI